MVYSFLPARFQGGRSERPANTVCQPAGKVTGVLRALLPPVVVVGDVLLNHVEDGHEALVASQHLYGVPASLRVLSPGRQGLGQHLKDSRQGFDRTTDHLISRWERRI